MPDLEDLLTRLIRSDVSFVVVGDFAEVKRHSVEIQLPAGACRVLSLDALIRSKEAMGRPRDREALLQLKAIRERLA